MIWTLLLLACGDGADDGTATAPTEPSTVPSSTTPTAPTDPSPGTDTSTRGTDVAVADLVDGVDAVAWLDDLQAFAVERPPGSTAWADLQDTCADRLAAYGYEVERHAYGTGTNVVGRLPGRTNADGAMVVSAHYDSVAGCTGADDNASGMASALEVARVMALAEWENDLWVACWDEEERGLIGSQAWATEAAEQGARIQLAWSFETMAYADPAPDTQSLPFGFELLFPEASQEVADRDHAGDFIAFIGDATGSARFYTVFAAQAEADGLPALDLLLPDELLLSFATADLRRSDHASFWEEGMPAVMLTDTADFRNDAYHCRNGLDDSVDRLDPDFAVKVVRATVAATAEGLGAPTLR